MYFFKPEMKFSTISVAIFAVSAVASPIADPRAEAVALPHWKSWWSGIFQHSARLQRCSSPISKALMRIQHQQRLRMGRRDGHGVDEFFQDQGHADVGQLGAHQA